MATSSPFLSGCWLPASPTAPSGSPATLCLGTIPHDLRGSFLRIGPNPSPRTLAELDPKAYHFFLGDGFVVGVEFGGDRVTCRCRFVETHLFKTGEELLPDGER